MHPLTTYLLIFGISLAAWLLFEIWLVLRGWPKALVRGRNPSGDRTSTALRDFAALAVAMALATNVPGIAPGFDVRTNYAVCFWTGIVMFWMGVVLRVWFLRAQGEGRLTGGSPRFLRHPAYTAGLAMLSGLGVSLGNGVSLALLLVTGALVYAARIRAEEATLRKEFGARFDEYTRRSWALIPFVW